MKLCPPAIVYLVLSIIGIIIRVKLFTFIHIIGIIIWTFLLNYLCSIGYSTISWILVLLPMIIMFGFIFASLGYTVLKH